MTKPHGQLYTDIVLTLLRHERNWVRREGCDVMGFSLSYEDYRSYGKPLDVPILKSLRSIQRCCRICGKGNDPKPR